MPKAKSPEIKLTTLSTATCPSLSGKSELKYSICKDDQAKLYIKLISNSNPGFFNADPIAVDDIAAILEKTSPLASVTSIKFAPLFRGSSSNSAGFLAAVAASLQLTLPIEGKARSRRVSPDYAEIITSLGNASSKRVAKKKVAKKKTTRSRKQINRS
jgi:hypothetical protein